jgi:hypothetical protein
MSKCYYIYLDSTDNNITTNKWFDFTTELKDGLSLLGKWQVAMTECNFNHTEQIQLDVYCDFCGYNIVNQAYHQIIRRVYKPGEFNILYFVDVSVSELKQLRIYIRDSNNEKPSVSIEKFQCTLKLIRK